MKQSLRSLAIAAALLASCGALSMALPMGKSEDGSLEQDVFPSLLDDQATESVLVEADGAKVRVPRVIVVAADPAVWRELRALQAGASVFKRRADENGAVLEHGGQQLPILRRDTMRCMVGRVYRPCWEV